MFLYASIAALAAPLAGEAQLAGKVARLGVLRSSSNPEEHVPRAASKTSQSRSRTVRLKLDVILVVGTPAVRAARDSITTVPVVFVTFADPVRTGLVASLARPGRNMTGLTMIAAEVTGKRLELLKEALPKMSRVAVLWNPANRDTEEQVHETRSAARSLGIQIEAHAASAPAELEAVFSAMAGARADAFFVASDAMFGRERRRIADLAARSRLPGMYHQRTYVDAGGRMSYGPNLTELVRRSGTYIDKILRGAKPAGRPARRAADQIRAGDQSQDRRGAEADNASIVATRADQVIE